MKMPNLKMKKSTSRRFFTRQFETVFFVILILSVFGLSLIFVVNDLFPNNGGFTRNILFIKPTEESNSGYFIIIDEVNPQRNKMPIDWVLHGRGNLSIFSDNQSAVWEVQSYLNPDIPVKLHAIFIEPEVIISESRDPFYPIESYVNNPLMIPSIRARPTQTGSTRFVTILYPLNGSQTLPNITTQREIGVTRIGDDSLLFTQSSTALCLFDNFTTDAQTLFLRMNSTDLSSFILQSGKFLSQSNCIYLASENTLSINLEYKPANISGTVWIHNPTPISLWVPNVPKATLLNGKDVVASYNPGNQTLIFTASENGSLLISYDPVMCITNFDPIISPKPTPPLIKNDIVKMYGFHPFLYFNESTLTSIRNRVSTEEPWQSWFSSLESNAKAHLDDDISSLSPESRGSPSLNLAFTGAILQNMTYITKAKEFLLAMDQVTDYEIHLGRARACGHYALAFDIIYQNLTALERTEIRDKLGNHTLPLVQKMDAIPVNNHIGVVASGIGLSGLVLENNEWVTLAISGIETYFSSSFGSDGGNYEGYSYAGYFLESALKFFYALQNVGVTNYFSDARFLSFINNTIYSLSPLITTPLFEDSTVEPQIIEDLLWAAAAIYPYEPLLSNYSQWVYDIRLLNDELNYDGSYLSSSDTSISGLVSRICMYSINVTPVKPPLTTMVIRPDSGLTFFRSNWDQDALYLTITCKSKAEYQYHAHYDECSFELWAYGAWLAANPGYPGFGEGEYDRIIQTEASNTILLNEEGQQRVNADGFQEYYRSSEIDGVVASATTLYSSPGSLTHNIYFLGVFMFIFTNLIIASLLIFYFRRQGYRSNITITPKQHKPNLDDIKTRNLTLKIHLGLLFGLTLGIYCTLIPFFLYTNTYIEGYLIGKHSHIAQLVPSVEIGILILTPILLILILSLKFKMQNSIVRRITRFSTNTQGPQIPPLKESVKLSYIPQIFFLIVFIPIIYLFYLPIIQDIVNFILTRAGSLLDIQNTIINSLNQFILLFAVTLLAYLPFKLMGLYFGGKSLSEKVEKPPSEGILHLTASYLLTLTFVILIIFLVTLLFFYALNFLGVSFIVA
jgi:hypothetical protein